jgi:predicted  nucleic acid-binding Zn-ribbon protein
MDIFEGGDFMSRINKTRSILALSSLALTLFASSPSQLMAERTPAQEARQVVAIEQLNESQNWKNDFYGDPSFRISDDSQLQDIKSQVNNRRNKLNDLQRQITPLKRKINEKTGSIKSKNEKVSELTLKNQNVANEVLAKTQEKIQVEKDINGLNGKITKKNEQINNAQVTVDLVQQGFDDAKAAFEAKKSECEATPSPECKAQRKELKQKMNQAKKSLNASKSQLAQFNKQKEGLVAQKQAKETKIAEINKFLVDIDSAVNKRRAKIAQLQKEVKVLRGEVSQLNSQIEPLKQRRNKVSKRLNNKIREFNNYRSELIATVLEANRLGVRMGRSNGSDDGLALARRLGNSNGNNDGDIDGETSGTTDGKARHYRLGYNQGQIDGKDRGNQEGQTNGTKDGTVQGNKDAATVAGRADGTLRAENSDAASVGQAQGRKDGLARADREGKVDGTRQGQAQSIKANESATLKTVSADGQFAGAFARRIPTFPWGFQGDRYSTSTWDYDRSIVKRAYRDGYVSQYDRAIRNSFERNISEIYNDAYDSAYEFSYDEFYNMDYPQSRKRGYNQGETDGFNEKYPIAYNKYFASLRKQFAANPNKASKEYKSKYKSVELATYNKVYEDIRLEQYNIFELNTFNDNIEERTNHYKAIRIAQVDELYAKYPVLKFNSSTITDTGISGVAVNDGVYQPGESVAHSITLTNLGNVAATNVVVTTDDGKKVTLPTIPAKTTLTVKGAASQNISSGTKVGAKVSKAFNIVAPLTAPKDKAIQGRHFRKRAQGMLALDTKQVRAAYPFSLSGLAANKTIVLGDLSKLSMSVSNNSKRAYNGPLKIEMDVNGYGQIVSKGFAPIQNISGSVKISDAEIMVTDHKDAYRRVNFKAKIVKNGVTLGFLDKPFTTMIKAPYKSRPGKPIVVVDSDKTANRLLDLLAVSGGIETVGILDTSLKKRNAVVLGASFQNKTVLLVPGGNATSSIHNMIKRSKNSAIIVVDGATNGMQELSKLKAFSYGISIPMHFKGIGAVQTMSTNKLMMGNAIADDTFVIKASTKYFKSYLDISGNLRISEDAILKKIAGTKYMGPKYFLKNTGLTLKLGQAARARMVHEILRVDKAVRTNKNRFSQDLVFNSPNFLMNKMVNQAAAVKKVTSANVGLLFFALDSKYGLKQGIGYGDFRGYKGLNSIKSGIKNKISGSIFSSGYVFKKIGSNVERALSKIDRKVVSGVRNAEGYYNPFPNPNGKYGSNVK